ncbi:MAG TPA: YIP1 family protein [Longimicrobium sp.]|jgi:hypothetical protein|uniref:YIP1 family protein n=1 Tax=Longimicrobium sp. TaxID=2029185 RepID=UPI002ED9D4E6
MTEISYAPPAEQPQAAPGSFPRRVLDTFLSPLAMFQRFGARPPWVDVTLLSMVLMVGAMAMIPARVFEGTLREAMAQRGQAMPAGAEQMAGVQRIFALGSAAFGPWIGLVITAGLLTLVFSVVMGGKASFRQYLSVAAHAGLIGAVGMWAKLPIILQKENMAAGISLAALVPSADPAGFLYKFLTAWEVFAVWQFVVLALGVSALGRKVGTGTALAVILGCYALVMAGFAAL